MPVPRIINAFSNGAVNSGPSAIIATANWQLDFIDLSIEDVNLAIGGGSSFQLLDGGTQIFRWDVVLAPGAPAAVQIPFASITNLCNLKYFSLIGNLQLRVLTSGVVPTNFFWDYNIGYTDWST